MVAEEGRAVAPGPKLSNEHAARERECPARRAETAPSARTPLLPLRSHPLLALHLAAPLSYPLSLDNFSDFSRGEEEIFEGKGGGGGSRDVSTTTPVYYTLKVIRNALRPFLRFVIGWRMVALWVQW